MKMRAWRASNEARFQCQQQVKKRVITLRSTTIYLTPNGNASGTE